MLEWITNISQIAGSVALVVSVLILLRELRENNRLARAANAQAMVGLSAPFYIAVAQDRKLAELYVMGIRETVALDAVDRLRYQNLLVWWLIFYENIYYQRRQGLLDRHAFEPWERDLEAFLRRQNVSAHWEDIKSLFQRKFAVHVGRLVGDPEAQGANGD